MENRIPLEKAALDLCIASAVPPHIYQLPPAEGRKKLDKAQNTPVYKYPAVISAYRMQPPNGLNAFNLYYVRPQNELDNPHVILYIHGAGWV
ncbi:MAG: lipase, partial [Oscillospiraceae bacterium]|nr:lipase [Oscillospiraceae bacterium]